MVTHRKNLHSPDQAATAEACFAAMQRHHAQGHPAAARAGILALSAASGDQGEKRPTMPPPAPGDIIYGARAIARFLFGEDGNTARRRVFNLWIHYRDRQERAGFFKLKGALCLSKKQWRDFHGLG